MTLIRRARLERQTRLASARGPLDKRARKRRKAGGKLAVGRDSGTREDLLRERAYVFQRAGGRCELCALVRAAVGLRAAPAAVPTDFAHVRARSAGGDNSRFNALATCNPCNLAMQGPFAKGRWLVTPIVRNGVRGFDAELVKAAGKFAYRLGEYQTLGHGWIAAEKP